MQTMPRRSLDLEATGLPASTSLLELAALALEVGGLAHVRAGLGVWHTRGLSEVAVHDASLDRSTKQDAVLACKVNMFSNVFG